jgi:hypothetical protein
MNNHQKVKHITDILKTLLELDYDQEIISATLESVIEELEKITKESGEL